MSHRARLVCDTDDCFPPYYHVCIMSVAAWARMLLSVYDEYRSDSAKAGVELAAHFADPLYPTHAVVCGFRIFGNSEYSAAVIGRLNSMLVGDSYRAVFPGVTRVVVHMRMIRVSLR